MSIAEAPARRYTAADLLTMPEGDRYELVDGELLESEMSAESSWISGEIHRRLANWAMEHSLGWVFPDNTGFQCFSWDEERVRKPDVAFVTLSKLPDGPPSTGYVTVAPDLAVEVVSAHDLYRDVEEKILEYLKAGVQAVWVVTPSTRTVMIHRSDNASPLHLTVAGEISGEAILPGFRARVADFFPPRAPESRKVTSP
jgi:Uma2 family endonuclease